MKEPFILILSLLSVLIFTGCGYHYGYGVRNDDPSIKFQQNKEHEIAGNFQFESVLFRPVDESFEVIIQHPIYPIPEPDILISQVGVRNLTEEPIDFEFKDVIIRHKNSEDRIINPIKKETITHNGIATYYVVKYDRKKMPKELGEEAKVKFDYKGKEYLIAFEADLTWAKRFSKFKIALYH
jgi:hypothetical protein